VARAARRGERRLVVRQGAGALPREFSDIYIAVVGAGEQSGHLGLVLERLADDLKSARRSTPS
jgi:type II secretory pathway component PulF